jgi:hypothetical protein
MLELSPPLPILLLLRVAGLSGLNTITVRKRRLEETPYVEQAKYHWNDKIKEGEMGERREMHNKFWSGNLEEGDNLKDIGVGKIMPYYFEHKTPSNL